MEGKNSVRRPRLRTRCENLSKIHSPRSEPPDQSFLIASLLRIAESEGIHCLNSALLLASLLLHCLESDISVLIFVDVLVSPATTRRRFSVLQELHAPVSSSRPEWVPQPLSIAPRPKRPSAVSHGEIPALHQFGRWTNLEQRQC